MRNTRIRDRRKIPRATRMPGICTDARWNPPGKKTVSPTDATAAAMSHRRAQAGQASLDDPAGLKPDKTPCHQQNDEKRGEHHPQGGADGPQGTAGHHAHVGGDVHGKGAGGALTHRHEIHQLGIGHPAVPRHLRLDEGQHGVTAPNGKGADFQKGPKQFQKDQPSFLLHTAACKSPAAAQPRMTSRTFTWNIAVATKAAPARK